MFLPQVSRLWLCRVGSLPALARREFEREYSSGFASFGLVDCRGVRGLTDGGRPGSRESRRSIGVPEEM